jgi:hypothetical protein
VLVQAERDVAHVQPALVQTLAAGPQPVGDLAGSRHVHALEA